MKKTYCQILETINRPGIKDLENYLSEKTDFFTAPASAKNHNNYAGGLVEHSLNVMDAARILGESFGYRSAESVKLCALLHDVCKINFYKSDLRNNKVNGVWIKEPYFSIDDKFPVGHGEKSVIILQRFIRMTEEEIITIRWHMAGFDDSAHGYSGGLALRNAYDKYPLACLIHLADMAAVYLQGDK
jgi:hypothetical protein